MNILILGAGQVATTLIQHLVYERSDITVVDNDPEQLHILNKHFDVRTVLGNASYPNILRKAGAEEADLLVAVTNSDEVNMVACQVAYSVFQVPKKIARLRSPHYMVHEELFGTDALPIDIVVCPEERVAQNVFELIQYPEAYQIFKFSNENINLLQARLTKPFSQKIPAIPIVAYARDNKILIPTDETDFLPGDDVFVLTPRINNAGLLAQLCGQAEPIRQVMIAGACIIGTNELNCPNTLRKRKKYVNSSNRPYYRCLRRNWQRNS